MGMDNTFFRLKKEDVKDKDGFDVIHDAIYGANYEKNPEEITYFRKNYEMNEVIEKVLKKDFIEFEIITKEQLEEIINILSEERKKCYTKEKETTRDIVERLKLEWTISTLETINKLFDFEKYYLVYECIY